MLDDTDPSTLAALFELIKPQSEIPARPVVLWFGAGTSSWARMLRWQELAETIGRGIPSERALFPERRARYRDRRRRLPRIFLSARRQTKRYIITFSLATWPPLSDSTCLPSFHQSSARDQAKAYHHQWMKCLRDTFVFPTIAGSNLERLPDAIQAGENFVAKSMAQFSDVSSLVFTKEEYDTTVNNQPYVNALCTVLQTAHVVFLGYGLADEYIIQKLTALASHHPLFGLGPHFLCTSDGLKHSPSSQADKVPPIAAS